MDIVFIVGVLVLMAGITVFVIVKETKERNREQADFNERLRAHPPIEGQIK